MIFLALKTLSDAVFILLINVKMPTIVDILTFMSRIGILISMSRINVMLNRVEHEKRFIISRSGLSLHKKHYTKFSTKSIPKEHLSQHTRLLYLSHKRKGFLQIAI